MKKLIILYASILVSYLLPFSNAEPFFNEGLNYTLEVVMHKTEIPNKQANASNLIQFLNKNYPIDYSQAKEIVAHSIDAAIKHNIEPELILAIIAIESTYNPKATSPV